MGCLVSEWTVDYEGDGFERFFDSLDEYEQAVLVAAVEQVLAKHGIDICSGEWGKSLKGGLYEFRIRKSLKAILDSAGIEIPPSLAAQADRTVLLRAFCTFHGKKIVLLFGGYNKRRDPSAKRQEREIKRARKALEKWKRGRS